MKIIIEKPLKIVQSNSPNFYSKVHEVHRIIKKYSIYYKEIYAPLYTYFIEAQTITLKEPAMNEFLSVLSVVVDFTLTFVPQAVGKKTAFLLNQNENPSG